MVGDNETNFPHKLLSTNRQVSNLRKAFANHLSADIKLSKTRLYKMIQSGRFLGRLLGPILKTGLPLIKKVAKPLPASVLIPFGLTAAASAADVGKHKKISGSGNTTLIISNDEIHIIKIVKALEDSGLLLKGVTETVQNEVKEQKEGFTGALLGTLGASLLGDLLKGKIKGKGITRAGEGVLELVMVVLHKIIIIKWIFNTTSFFNKL